MINLDYDIFDRFDDINYIPVLTGWNQNFVNRNKDEISFITKDALFKYNKWLVNPYHDEKTWVTIVEGNKLIDNSIIFADSGGLQEVTLKGTPKAPEDILLWQQKYANIGFALDKIPYIIDGGTWIFDEVNFEKYAQKTRENIDRALAVRTEFKKFKFYAIIQGNDPQSFEVWRKIIDRDGIDGYCCKCSYNSPLLIAKTAYYATTLDKPIHFLGMGNLTKTIILLYAKNYIKNKISFDSSSWDTGSQYRNYQFPFSQSHKMQILSKDNKLKDFTFCNCPYCKKLSEVIVDPEKDDTVGPLISLHNLNMNVSMFKYLSQIYTDKEELRTFVKAYFKEDTGKKILLAFDYVDDAVNKGLKYATSKYTEDMFEDKKTIQKSLF